MTHREKCAHLSRRFGLGARVEELDRWEDMTLAEVEAEVLDFSEPEFDLPASNFFYNAEGELELQPPRVGAWWMGRMCVTDRPARDKLLVFLHDHFAVSAEKVANAVLMLDHLRLLESGCHDTFAVLLERVTLDPAMMFWLDLQTSVKGTPNENYARELLELFTLSIGHYSETDVLECARALTGWSLRNLYEEAPEEKRPALVAEWMTTCAPIVVPTMSPSLCDRGPHKILGTERSYSVQSLCAMLAEHPQTTRYLSLKLWEYYAYPDPEDEVVERLANVFVQKQRRMTDVVRAIAGFEEFWSERAVRAVVKSPVDYVVPIVRQVVPREVLVTPELESLGPFQPPPDTIGAVANGAFFLASQMGMTVLYPPDVAGWEWGSGWINTSTVLDRIGLADLLCSPGAGNVAAGAVLRHAMARGVKTEEALVDAMAELFDAPLGDQARAVLAESAKAEEVISKALDLPAFSAALTPVMRGLFAAPGFQMM